MMQRQENINDWLIQNPNLTWFKQMWVCEGAWLAQIPVWNLLVLGRLDGKSSERT